jgi:hypothetical protein
MADDKQLPAVPTDVHGAVQYLEDVLRQRDGPLSVSTATVPARATDVGDDCKAQPRACDLGYPEGYECAVEEDPKSGRIIMSDPPNWALAGDSYIHAAEEDVIDDVREWA